MKFTVLIDRKGSEPFFLEHGLSYFIELGADQILLDAGSSGKIAQNAKFMNISLSDINFAVLSHGHYDHCDGFRTFFQENSSASLFLRKEALDAHFSFTKGTPKFVGIHKSLDHNRFFFVEEEVYSLCPSVFLISYPKNSKLFRKDDKFYQKKIAWDHFQQDTFSHQQSLVVLLNEELLIFNSCFHGDILGICQDILEKFPDYKSFSLVGGLHLQTDEQNIPLFSEQDLDFFMTSLVKIGLNRVYTGHCTSDFAFSLLKKYLNERLFFPEVGETVEFI